MPIKFFDPVIPTSTTATLEDKMRKELEGIGIIVEGIRFSEKDGTFEVQTTFVNGDPMTALCKQYRVFYLANLGGKIQIYLDWRHDDYHF